MKTVYFTRKPATPAWTEIKAEEIHLYESLNLPIRVLYEGEQGEKVPDEFIRSALYNLVSIIMQDGGETCDMLGMDEAVKKAVVRYHQMLLKLDKELKEEDFTAPSPPPSDDWHPLESMCTPEYELMPGVYAIPMEELAKQWETEAKESKKLPPDDSQPVRINLRGEPYTCECGGKLFLRSILDPTIYMCITCEKTFKAG